MAGIPVFGAGATPRFNERVASKFAAGKAFAYDGFACSRAGGEFLDLRFTAEYVSHQRELQDVGSFASKAGRYKRRLAPPISSTSAGKCSRRRDFLEFADARSRIRFHEHEKHPALANCKRLPARNSRSSCSVALAPSLRTRPAKGRSCHCRMRQSRDTQASLTAGAPSEWFSRSTELIHSPPDFHQVLRPIQPAVYAFGIKRRDVRWCETNPSSLAAFGLVWAPS